MSARSNPSALEHLVVEKKAEPILLMLSDADEQAVELGNTINGVSTNRDQGAAVVYKLYKRRWLGLVGMVVLNVIAAMNWIWFSPIANSTAGAFHISLPRVNWLSQVVNLVYIPMALSIPYLVRKFGIRFTCYGAAFCLLLASWIRFGAVSKSLSDDGAYALLITGQIFAGIAQPVFQVLGPKFSETWFDLKARTTATMVIAIANPIGTALGQLLPPFISTPRASLVVLAVATTATLGLVFLIQESPPTPPTFAGSRPSPPFLDTILALAGRLERSKSTSLQEERDRDNSEAGITDIQLSFTKQERIDMVILAIIFGVLVGAVSTFSILINQIFAPVGYSEETSGFFGAALLLMGILSGLITSPLFDRVLTHHLTISIRIVLPPMAACWIGLIFAVKPHNDIAIYILAGLIGIFGFLLLPVGLELGCEITRNAEASAAILWMSGNLFTLIFVLVANAIHDPNPPYSMKNMLIFIAAFVSAASFTVIPFKGDQTRRKLDMTKIREANNVIAL